MALSRQLQLPGIMSGLGKVAGALLLGCAPFAVQAQDLTRDVPPPPAVFPGPAPIADGGNQIDFSAESLNYDNSADVVTAEGAVYLERDATRLRADRVTWNRTSGEVVAEGNVAVTNPEGDIAYGDRIVLTDSLRDGIVDNMLVVLGEGGRLAALKGTRLDNGDIILNQAAYTPCSVETGEGCPREPSWQIKAVEVYYDDARQRVRYKGARVEVFGIPLIPLPGLSHSIGQEAGSGVLVPNLRIDRNNGVEVALPYYIRLAPNRDITVTGHVYTDAAPMLEAEYRALNSLGSYRIAGYATYSQRTSVSGAVLSERDFRGYLDASGKFQIDPRWSVTASGRVATDRTFLRRYDISRDDRLRSNVSIERNGGSSYLSIQGWAVQTLRTNDRQGLQPIALPVIDFRQQLRDPLLGGRIELHANTLAIARTSGQDTQRAFASARWDLRRLTGMGQEITLTGLLRGDAYHSDENLLTAVPSYRGNSGWEYRGVAAAALDVRWPFAGSIFGGTQMFTPRVQFAATPPIRNLVIPNEDSRAFDLEDTNLFALNRFPGYDRFEDGARITYGAEWAFTRPGLAISSVVGQSYRLSDKPSLFPDGTGLTSRTSDIVGRTTVAFRDFVRVTHRYRLDKDNLAVRRNEFDATVGSRRTYAEVGYLRLNRDITNLAEDLADREEVRLGGRVAFARNWSLFGSAVIDLTDRAEDPASGADGFEPVRHRLGVAYDDDCLTIGLTWRRDYEDTGDARRGNSFLLRIALRNLGV